MLHPYFIPILLAFLHLTIAQIPTNKATSVLTQRFLHPTQGDVLLPGTTFTIKWEPNATFKNITLQLWDKTSWGFSRDLLTPCHPWGRSPFCGTIASSIPNTGSFEWTIPNPQNGSLGFGFPRGERAYWMKMYVEDYFHAEIGNQLPVLSYSPNFEFAKPGEAGTLVTEQMTSTVFDAGPPTVYVTVTGEATATGTGDMGSFGEGPAPTRLRNSTTTSSLVPLEGAGSKITGNFLGGILLLLGLL